jgi:hypothetical protein
MGFPGTQSLYRGFDRWDFMVADVPAIVVAPHQADAQRNWVWRAEFWDHEPGVDLALLAKVWPPKSNWLEASGVKPDILRVDFLPP